jgi:hypothetical protein
MSTPSKKKKSGSKNRERVERRFMPVSTTDRRFLYLLLMGGGLLAGAGAFAYWGRDGQSVFHEQAFYLFAAASVFVSAALWFSSGSAAAVRVGAAGVAVERGGLQRMPWYALESLSWAAGEHALVLTGSDEAGAAFTFQVSAKAHPAACAWIVAEAKDRVAKVVDLADEVRSQLGSPDPYAGVKMNVPLHVVGRRCAQTGAVITFEPDARTCIMCERVYHKHSVPEVCACDAQLQALRDQVGASNEDSSSLDAAVEA